MSLRHLALAAAVLAGSAGCAAGTTEGPVGEVRSAQSTDGYAGTLLSGPAVPRPALVLPDTSGEPYDLRSDTDGVTALFFGYTQCPDVCPSTMADLAVAVRDLPQPDRERVAVVFVAEDPANDTPAAVREWLDHFDEEFIGLIGGDERTAQVLDELHLPRTERHVDPPDAAPHDHGGVEHSGVVYLFGPGDRATVVHSGGTTGPQYAGDIRRLLAQG